MPLTVNSGSARVLAGTRTQLGGFQWREFDEGTITEVWSGNQQRNLKRTKGHTPRSRPHTCSLPIGRTTPLVSICLLHRLQVLVITLPSQGSIVTVAHHHSRSPPPSNFLIYPNIIWYFYILIIYYLYLPTTMWAEIFVCSIHYYNPSTWNTAWPKEEVQWIFVEWMNEYNLYLLELKELSKMHLSASTCWSHSCPLEGSLWNALELVFGHKRVVLISFSFF